MRAILITQFLCLLFTGPSGAQTESAQPNDTWGRTIPRTLEHEGQTYAWSVMIPRSANEGGRALLFLHGAGECGTDGKRNLKVGLPKHIRDNPDQWPFVVIVPQKPTRNSEWEDHEEAVLKMLDLCAEEGLIDPDRLAITGLSQGGHGTIMLASRNPGRFKAAAAVCGYVDRRIDKEGNWVDKRGAQPTDKAVKLAAKRLVDTPVWLVHGDADQIISVEESRALEEAMGVFVRQNPGSSSKTYIEHQDVGHNVWDHAYSDTRLAEWFKEHTAE
ncbi:MAG: hypothetical protein ED559_10980 [Phycisphaera sp.]|nr:MAG: hypothetical protein ED559_10980 [Phycisphaera sp.]